jgi:hypothetical protein
MGDGLRQAVGLALGKRRQFVVCEGWIKLEGVQKNALA